MAKPLYATEDMINEAVEKITKDMETLRDKLAKGILDTGKIEYKETYKWKDKCFDRPKVRFTAEAWAKMLALVNVVDSEIAWNGLVNRIDDNTYEIYDILMYPQEVTGATVTVDQKERLEWLLKLPRENQSKVRFQGHSHVNMAPSPSGTDMATRKDVIAQISEGEYYIFLIINKSLKMTMELYDMVTNGVYDTEDIDIELPFDFKDWADKQVKDNIKKKTYSYAGVGTFLSGYKNYSGTPASDSKKVTDKDTEKDKDKSKASGKKDKSSSNMGYDYHDYRNVLGYDSLILAITASDIEKQFEIPYSYAYQIYKELLHSYNMGLVKNNYADLLEEATALYSDFVCEYD